jgi:hypothetical protein
LDGIYCRPARENKIPPKILRPAPHPGAAWDEHSP